MTPRPNLPAVHLDPEWVDPREPTDNPPMHRARPLCGALGRGGKLLMCIPVNADSIPRGTRFCVNCEHSELVAQRRAAIEALKAG